MSTSTNAEIVRRFFDERWNKRNLAVYDELRSKDEGIEDQIAWFQRCLDAWSECTMTMPNLVAQDDQVAVHFEVSVVFADDFPGYYAKGESVDFDGMALLRLKDGVIVEDTSYGRDPKMLQFLGEV